MKKGEHERESAMYDRRAMNRGYVMYAGSTMYGGSVMSESYLTFLASQKERRK